MEIVRGEEQLKSYMDAAVGVTRESPILIDKFLQNAMETEADAISDGNEVYVPAVMEHIELAGIHSATRPACCPASTLRASMYSVSPITPKKSPRRCMYAGL